MWPEDSMPTHSRAMRESRTFVNNEADFLLNAHQSDGWGGLAELGTIVADRQQESFIAIMMVQGRVKDEMGIDLETDMLDQTWAFQVIYTNRAIAAERAYRTLNRKLHELDEAAQQG